MAADPATPVPVRASDLERDAAVRTLRDRAAEGRISFDTFARRIEAAQRAKSREQLDELLRDLPPSGAVARLVANAVARASSLAREVELAWRRPRVPRLALPEGRDAVALGRSVLCDYRLDDPYVSRWHARLKRSGDGWLLEDFASTNGTRLNGVRVLGSTPVRSGDLLTLGRSHVRIS